MHRKAIILFLFVIISSAVFSQEKYDKQVDVKTYELYMKSDWNGLLDAVDNAIDEGIDFYYLRMRAGIAYYTKENYMSSIPHFRQALVFKPSDSTALEYLYYSYLLSGNESDALITGNKLPPGVKKRTGYKAPEFFKGAYTEGGYTSNLKYSESKDKNILGTGGLHGEQLIFKNSTYINLSLIHSLGNRVSVFQGYNNIAVNSVRQFSQRTMGKSDFNVTTRQNEYYINLKVNAGRGTDLFAAFHYLNVKTEDFVPAPDTNYFPPRPFFAPVSSASDEFIFTSGVSKSTGHVNLGYSFLISNMNDAKQAQNTLTFIWYPFGNLNLYTVSNIIFHSNKNSPDSEYLTRTLFDEKLGVKVADKLWLEGVFTSGKIYNFSESNAFIVYNNIDRINFKAGANVIYIASPEVELSLRFLYLEQEQSSTTFAPNSSYVTTTENIPTIKIIGGLKWTF